MKPDWDKIKADYETGAGGYTPQEIAKLHNVTYEALRVQKSRKHWGDYGKGLTVPVTVTKKVPKEKVKKEKVKVSMLQDPVTKNIAKIQKEIVQLPGDKKDFRLPKTRSRAMEALGRKGKSNIIFSEIDLVINDMSDELTEREKLFCLNFVRHNNATLAAIQAGYAKNSAHVTGSCLLTKPKIRSEIARLRGFIKKEIMFDALSVLEIYLKIATADTNDYVKFGKKKVPMLDGEGKPVVVKGKQIMITESFVDIEDSSKVDGTLISEISQGKEGIKVKFHDKMKALEKLEKYFDLIPDLWQRKIEETKLKMEEEKLAIEKGKQGITPDGETQADDGFIDALNSKAGEVWQDEGSRPSSERPGTQDTEG